MDHVLKILIVDDDPDSLDSIHSALTVNGYQADKCHDPLEALDMSKKNDYHVIITDIKMPRMDGIELLKQVRASKPETRVLIMTGFADTDNAIQAVNYNAVAFFRKPVDLEQLLRKLDQIHLELRKDSFWQQTGENLTRLYLEYRDFEENINQDTLLQQNPGKSRAE